MPLASSAYARPLDPRFCALATGEALRALPDDARLALAATLAAALGSRFEPCPSLAGTFGLPAVVHLSSSMRFVAIPGGEFTMGMTREEIDEVARLYAPLRRAEEARAHVCWATQPPRGVRVQPFLCAEEPLAEQVARALLPDLYADDVEDGAAAASPALVTPRRAADARGALGFRFLAEAEWEWLAREGGARRWLSDPPEAISLALDPDRGAPAAPNAFGVSLLRAGLEFVADTWHGSYEGAPSIAIAWEPRAIPDHARGCHGGWQDEMEAVRLHVGVREGRHGDEPAAVRFALDLP